MLWSLCVLFTGSTWLCLCRCTGVAFLYCTCLLYYWGACERERWLDCCGSCLLRLSGNLTPVYLEVLPEGHCSSAQCSIQGQSSKILNTTMCWQRVILTMRTMARAEQCILIPLLLIFRFGEVLKYTGSRCAAFMVKTCLCNTYSFVITRTDENGATFFFFWKLLLVYLIRQVKRACHWCTTCLCTVY